MPRRAIHYDEGAEPAEPCQVRAGAVELRARASRAQDAIAGRPCPFENGGARGISMPNTKYDRDFYAWTNEQAALLRAGKLIDEFVF